MKKFKKILATVFAFVFIVTATGCAVNTDMTIGADKKVTANVEIKISKTEIDGVIANMGDDAMVTSADVVSMLKEAGAKTTTESGETYYVITEKSTSTLDELNQSTSVGVVGNYSTTDVWAYCDTSISFLGIDSVSSIDMLKQMGIDLSTTTTIKMPYKITKTNLTEVDEYTVTETGDLDNIGSSISYIITEKSTAAWTKAENVEAEILKMAKPAIAKQLTYSIDVMAGYKSKNSLIADVSAPYCTGGTIEYCEGNGKYKTLKNFKVENANNGELTFGIGAVDNFSATIKNVKAGKKYTFKVTGYYDSKDLGRIYSSAKTASVKVVNFNKVSVKKLVSAKKSFKVTVKSADKPDKYQIQYATNKKFKGAKIKTVNAGKKTFTVKKLKSGTKYFVRVRKVVVSSNYKNLKGNWSKAKTVTAK